MRKLRKTSPSLCKTSCSGGSMTTDVRGTRNSLLTETKSSCMYSPAALQPHGHHCPHFGLYSQRSFIQTPNLTQNLPLWSPLLTSYLQIYQLPPVDAFIAYLLCGSITVVVQWLICKVHFSARMEVPWGQGLWLSCFPLTLMSSTALWCIPDTQDIPIFVYWWIEWTNEWLNQTNMV